MKQLPSVNSLIVAAGLTFFGAATAFADRAKTAHEPPFTVWDIVLGGEISQIPERDLAVVACGTNGGPPSRPLDSLSDFKVCPAEGDGSHEVYLSYDDELEYRALALELPTEAALHAGTTVAGHPVVVSVLVSNDGVIGGIRVVTDSRAEIRDRRRAASLAATLKSRFQGDWNCVDQPPDEGEVALSGVFIKQTCERSDPQQDLLLLNTRYLRKKGQRSQDRATGKRTKGAFESLTRFEQRKR